MNEGVNLKYKEEFGILFFFEYILYITHPSFIINLWFEILKTAEIE
jgi:hypothetical protein